MSKNIKFSGFSDFDFRITYSEKVRKEHFFQIDSHVHTECEIYINLSGDISFMVDDKIYDIEPGDVIIVGPNEYHHCIYRSDELHRHFWILISVNENQNILEPFFNKEDFGALVRLNLCDKENLISICNHLQSDALDECEKYILFFKLMRLLKSEKTIHTTRENTLPKDIISAIDYINKHLSQNISITDIAKSAFVSINTLERHFRENLNMSPTAFIKDKRLIYSAKLLRSGKNVLDAAMESGFCDSSHFIVCFKKKFKMTPLVYKKEYESQSSKRE